MKENDIVELVCLNEHYVKSNLYKNVYGIVLKNLENEKCSVLFLNDKNVGDYAIVDVKISDIKLVDAKLPANVLKELKKSDKINKSDLLIKTAFETIDFNECDYVELLVEKEKYACLGVHKGDIGIVAIDYAVNGTILVDFFGANDNGEYVEDCISVDIEDLKIVD